MRVFGLQFADVRKERLGAKGVDAGVDLPQALLIGRKRLLLDDCFDLGRIRLLSQHPAVAGGVGRSGGEDGHSRALLDVKIAQAGDGFRLQEGDVSGEDEKLVVSFDSPLGGLDGVTRPTLLFLVNEADAGIFDGGLDGRGLMSDDNVDVGRRDDLTGAVDHVTEQRLAADFVEHLGALGLEARALASSHDDNCELHRNRVQGAGNRV